MDWFSALPWLDKMFLLWAAAGTLVVGVRLVLMLVGADADHGDLDVAADGADSSFTVLSLQALGAFWMLGGLVGLAMHRGSGFAAPASVAASVAAGSLAVWLIRFIFRSMGKLQSSGTIAAERWVGAEGEIAYAIPAQGTGVARLRLSGASPREFDAASQDGAAIATGVAVKVVARKGRQVVVTPL